VPAARGDALGAQITDLDPHSLAANGGLDDVSQVEKYEISEEAYMARDDNFRKFREKKLAADPTWSIAKEMRMREHARLKKLDPNFVPPPEPERVTDPEHQAEEAAKVSVGQRCQVTVGERRGEVKYVGKVEGIGVGYWVGIQYDEPVGKNDGSIKGKRYFECLPNYGGFVRPANLQVGDFPERGLSELEDSDEEEGNDAAKGTEDAVADGAGSSKPGWVDRAVEKAETAGGAE